MKWKCKWFLGDTLEGKNEEELGLLLQFKIILDLITTYLCGLVL